LVGESETDLRFHYYGPNLLVLLGGGREIMFQGRIRFLEDRGQWKVGFSLWKVPSLVVCGMFALILAVGLPWVIVHTMLQSETPTVDCYAGVVGLVVITAVAFCRRCSTVGSGLRWRLSGTCSSLQRSPASEFEMSVATKSETGLTQLNTIV